MSQIPALVVQSFDVGLSSTLTISAMVFIALAAIYAMRLLRSAATGRRSWAARKLEDAAANQRNKFDAHLAHTERISDPHSGYADRYFGRAFDDDESIESISPEDLNEREIHGDFRGVRL